MAGQAPVAGPSPTAVSESTCEESKTTRRNESKDIAEIHLDSGEREVDTNIMIVKVRSRVNPGILEHCLEVVKVLVETVEY
jgi:hypothetical protein